MKVVENNNNLKQRVDRLKLPYLVLAASLILTLGFTYIFYRSSVSKDRIRFNNYTSNIQNTIESRIGLYTALLKSGRGFIEANEDLEYREFANFVGSLELEKNYKGVQGIGYSVIFKPEEKEKLIEQLKSQGFTNFRIFPDSASPLNQSIIFLEPSNEINASAVGYDMSTEPNRLAALERAAETGEAAATAQVTLLQNYGNKEGKGFLIYLPIYKDASLPRNAENRRENLRGFIYSPFKAENFLGEIHGATGINDLKIRLYDGNANAENLMAVSNISETAPATPDMTGSLFDRNQINVAGRTWNIEYETLPAFFNQSSVGWTPLILLTGSAFSLILFGLMYWEATARFKVQKIASELFESEKQKRKLLIKEQEARASAEYANRAKDEFFSVISHELRTPLNAIAGWSRILRANHLSDDKRKTALDKIEKSLRHQTDLIDDMLDYSQMVTNNSEIKEENFVFSQVYNEVIDEMKPAVEEKHILLENHNTLNGCVFKGDKDKIKVLFTNILSNAVKFTPEGGKVSTDLHRSGQEINLAVQDTGIGIKKEFLPHIFEQFRQADSTITRRYGGIGLGLAISKHIVKLHNGTIEAKSQGENKGTTVVVKIPLNNSTEN